MNLFESPVQTMTVQNRLYQDQAIQAAWLAYQRGVRGLTTMPTGTGKTIVFAHVVKRVAEGGGRVAVLAHRGELQDQNAQKIRAVAGCAVGTEQADVMHGGEPVVTASVQTIGRLGSPRLLRLMRWLNGGKAPGLLIVDEAHHAAATSYQTVIEAAGCYAEENPCRLLGYTATPHRLDNKALTGHGEIFTEHIYDYNIREAIGQGYLCDIRGFRLKTDVDLRGVKTRAGDFVQSELAQKVDTPARNLAALRHWERLARERQTIVFCVNVAHATNVEALFQAAGYSAEMITGECHSAVRESVFNRFRSGQLRVLVNVEIATEGFDHPPTSAILMLRPTKSWSLYCQMVGRGTRIHPGKQDVMVLDVVDVTNRFSLASVPSMLGLPAELDLEGKKLTEAADMMQRLGDKASLIGRVNPTSFTELEGLMERVDLLADVEVPAEIKGASQLRWLPMPNGAYQLSCGTQEGLGQTTASMLQDALGHFTLTLRATHRTYKPIELGPDPKKAFFEADRTVLATWPGVGALVSSTAKWRDAPATPAQRKVLVRHGVSPKALQTMTKGKASDMISRIFGKEAAKV